MEPYCEKNRSQAGLSLVELLIVILVISVVAALALMQRGSANEQFQRQNAARELKVAFERARFDSVKRRTDCNNRAKVVTTANSFTLFTDKNMDGVVTDPDEGQVASLPSGIVISQATTVNFNHRGEATSPGTLSFYVCNGTCNSPNTATADIVIVTPTGTVKLLPGNSDANQSYGDAGVTSVPTTSGINDRLIISGGAATPCTP